MTYHDDTGENGTPEQRRAVVTDEKKFTPEDVAVGDTVHLIERWGEVSERHLRGKVFRSEPAWVAVENGGKKASADWSEVEIVSVEKPKRELVTGGVYETTDAAGTTTLRRRFDGGWGYAQELKVSAGSFWRDDEVEEWTIGRRVLLVDRPSERPGVTNDHLVVEAITREQAR